LQLYYANFLYFFFRKRRAQKLFKRRLFIAENNYGENIAKVDGINVGVFSICISLVEDGLKFIIRELE
jgi:hypothetical protein